MNFAPVKSELPDVANYEVEPQQVNQHPVNFSLTVRLTFPCVVSNN
jgi:hypothetical protein